MQSTQVSNDYITYRSEYVDVILKPEPVRYFTMKLTFVGCGLVLVVICSGAPADDKKASRCFLDLYHMLSVLLN